MLLLLRELSLSLGVSVFVERAQANKNYHKTFVVWSPRTGDDDMTVAVTMTNDDDINNTDNDNIGDDRIHD